MKRRKRTRKPKQPKYKPSVCRNCGKTFTYQNPEGTRRVGGRPAVYCSDKCREEWRAKYKRRVAQKHRREESRRLQSEGVECCIVDYKRDRELEQLVMELELYPELLRNLFFAFKFPELDGTDRDWLVEESLEVVDSVGLSTGYLNAKVSWHIDEIGIDL